MEPSTRFSTIPSAPCSTPHTTRTGPRGPWWTPSITCCRSVRVTTTVSQFLLPSERYFPSDSLTSRHRGCRPPGPLLLLEEVRLLFLLLLQLSEAPGDLRVRGLQHLSLRHPGSHPEEAEEAVLPGLPGPPPDEVHQVPRELPVRQCGVLYPL